MWEVIWTQFLFLVHLLRLRLVVVVILFALLSQFCNCCLIDLFKHRVHSLFCHIEILTHTDTVVVFFFFPRLIFKVIKCIATNHKTIKLSNSMYATKTSIESLERLYFEEEQKFELKIGNIRI